MIGFLLEHGAKVPSPAVFGQITMAFRTAAPLEIGDVPVDPNLPLISFTSPFNLTGSPAASVPAG